MHEGMAVDHGAVRKLLADWYCWSRGLQNFDLRMRSLMSSGKTPGPEASVGKLMQGAQRQLFLSELLDMLDMGGSAAASGQGFDLHFALLHVISNRVAGGTDEILRNIIAERVLGLPPEHRVDKDIAFNRIPTSLTDNAPAMGGT